MRVVFLTYYFPPDPAVGAIRARELHDAFRRAGHQVHVITRRLAGVGRQPSVNRVPTLPNPREIALALRRLVRGRRASDGSGNLPTGAYRPPDDVPGWKRFLLAMALMPDDYHGFILPAVTRSLPYLLRGVDLVYTSGPPHSVHLAGLTLAHLTGVRWAAEFRDPWTDNAIQARYARSATADRIRAWLERRCMRRADVVVAVTAGAAEVLAGKTRAPVVVARNGVPAAALSANGRPPARRSEGPRRILYLGNLYHQRDPRPLFRALAALRARSELPAEGVRVDLYGECGWFDGVSIPEAARAAGVGDLVRVHGRVPLEEARRLTHDADLLLLLARQQPLQVPQKLYEYVAAGRPILAFTDAHSETASILSSLGGHFIVDGDAPDQVEHVVRCALRQRRFDPPAAETLAQLSAEHQMDMLVEKLAAFVR